MLFKDDFFFLSTFYICPFSMTINNEVFEFRCLEAAFQAQRIPELAERFQKLKGLEAKRLSENLPKVKNWETRQLYAMALALNALYKNKGMLFFLKCIKEPIIHDNYWHDTFWGVYKGVGQNIYGRMLMNIRDNNNDLVCLLHFVETELLPEQEKLREVQL